MLYLIEILHQTTTFSLSRSASRCCILSKFYIKPQLYEKQSPVPMRCILSKFYIKPQRRAGCHTRRRCCILSKFYIKPQPKTKAALNKMVVSYRNSTSNHNRLCGRYSATQVVSYRNSTSNHNTAMCYINGIEVVSYRNSTSNHNFRCWRKCHYVLYLIEILHQTTTCA